MISLAQHHGIPTRLLDWSTSPLVAAFFSVLKERVQNTAIYSVTLPEYSINSAYTDPFAVKEVGSFEPPHIDARIAAQHSIFTIHPEPQKPFEHESLTQWTIDSSIVVPLKRRLDTYGVNYATMFPGLDGTARYINWIW